MKLNLSWIKILDEEQECQRYIKFVNDQRWDSLK